MTITSSGTGAYRLATRSQFVSARNDLTELQRQLATQQKSTTYGGLGIDRTKSLDLNAKIASLDSWLAGIETAGTNLKLQSNAVESIAKVATQIRTDISTSTYLPSQGGLTGPQILAEGSFAQAIDLLNIDVNGRYLFSGRTTDVKPTESTDLIINGDGVKAGLKTLIAERATADGVAAGGQGRLGATSATNVATLARDTGFNAAYGFNISPLSSGSTNLVMAVDPPADPTSLTVTVGPSQPLLGEQIRIKLDLPDGTQTEILLTAKDQSDPASADGFAIGATTADTAKNISDAIGIALKNEAQTTLKAASAIWTTTDFFDSSVNFPPRRVPADLADPPTRAGAAANTVIWYQGEDGLDPAVALDPLADDPRALATGDPVLPNPSARNTAGVQVDRTQIVSIGTRANEGAIRASLANLAAFSLVEFPQGVATSQSGYNALAERVRDGLSYEGGQRPSDIAVELGVAQNALKSATERHEATKAYFETTLGGVQEIDKSLVATQILALQTSLESSYQVTSILSKLSLTNYL
ncbi:hypothetical protein IP69_15360 [Bosea sp. AAP35]|uniref:flagellin n=1 Tax=Bosea sp. AAP35 TaxID=1523417 RepID=UPI0006B967E7|nr:flagellin [Bosea sp. AAP35]KPF66248.1 hypothetical protein IP69_15360 [Bosea sp. AAP35]